MASTTGRSTVAFAMVHGLAATLDLLTAQADNRGANRCRLLGTNKP